MSRSLCTQTVLYTHICVQQLLQGNPGTVWCGTATPLHLRLSVILPGDMTQNFTAVPSDLKSWHSSADIPGSAWLPQKVTANPRPCLWLLRAEAGVWSASGHHKRLLLADAGKILIRVGKSLLLILCWECFC